MKLLATIILIICVNSKLQALIGSPYQSNYYNIITRLDTLLPPYTQIEDNPRTEYYRWMEYWGKRLYPTSDFNIHVGSVTSTMVSI